MLKSILISTVILLLLAGLTYSQTENKVPQYLLDQLQVAEDNENIEESNRILNIINTKYNDGGYVCDSEVPVDIKTEAGTDEGTYNPPYNPDWMSSDRLVYSHSGTQTNVTRRTLDIEYCEENGKLYIAACVNISGFHGIRVYSSNNSGLTWTYEGGIFNNTIYFTGLSMKVEQRYDGRPDSVRVNIFYTRASSSNNNNARLAFWSFKPDGSHYSIRKTIATPSAGNEFRLPSAYSNGQFYSTGTDIGCIVGEYNNAGTNCISLRKYYMMNWSWNFIGYSYTSMAEDYWPSAVYKNNPLGTDSVYIAVERRFFSDSRISVIRTRAWGGGSWPYIYITSPSAYYYRKPCLTIPQNRYPTRMAITYTRNTTSSTTIGLGRRSHSYNGGFAWSHGNLGNSYTTSYTWVASDSNGSAGNCTFIWGDADSLNVKRSRCSFVGGTTYYDRASNIIALACFPVCAVYNNSSGNHRRSTFAYWRYLTMTGVKNIYFDAENLPTGITNTSGVANTYSLSQNFPNPFNPTTTINFSIPKDGLVKLVVFDILGKEVATLVNNEQSAGNYQVTFDASKLTSGVYFYKITSGDFSDVKKMMLIK